MLVADGHGGAEAAQMCRASVCAAVVALAAGDPSKESLQGACSHAIMKVHDEVVATTQTAGSTLTIVVINLVRSELTLAHVGDSAAMLVEDEAETLLTEEHRLENSASERERVQATGATIQQARTVEGIRGGPLRAYPGGLAVCRTIGDADCPCASAVPHVHSVPFDASAGAAVIACSDGVWDALSAEKVAACVRRSRTASSAAEYVVTKAIKARGVRDDTSAVVAWLGIPPWDESRFESTASRLGHNLGRKLALAFGSRSPSTSPASSRCASPLASPAASHQDLAALGEQMMLLDAEHAEAGSSPPRASLKVSL